MTVTLQGDPLMEKNTQCVHSGTLEDPATRGLNTPIFTSSSFRNLDAAQNLYPRYFNTPNQKSVVDKLCALEHAEAGLLFSSGMAAVSTVMLALLGPGDHLVVQRDIYGGTHHLVTSALARFGVEVSFVTNRPNAVAAAVRPNTRLIYIETPSNPLLRVIDIAAVAETARSRQIPTAIDNTFATPVNQNPFDMGIDIVVHSGTKYLGGHSDLCCGAVLTSRDLARKIHAAAASLGGSLNAATCYLLERSLKTLAIRVERQNRNALVLARFLRAHPRVARVHYPGLEDHPGFEIARRQMRGFGGMLAFEPEAAAIGSDRFLRRLRLIAPALSLGGVETIVCVPAVTSHAELSVAERTELGISDNLLRLSVGIEDVDDLVADIDQALRP
jgi:cystathionine beta-lyase/cystathionine gamma-synthase